MLLFYITCSSAAEAEAIANQLLKEKLIACANILPGVKSLYVWEDELQNSKEVILLLKTPEKNQPLIESRITALHSYDCPCILSFKPDSVNPAFLNFVSESTN